MRYSGGSGLTVSEVGSAKLRSNKARCIWLYVFLEVAVWVGEFGTGMEIDKEYVIVFDLIIVD